MRDLEEAAKLTGGAPLGREGGLEHLPELLRPLMQPRVLNRDRELARERDEEPLLTRPVRPRTLLVDGERADHLVAHDEWDDERAPHPRLRKYVVQPGEPTSEERRVGKERR